MLIWAHQGGWDEALMVIVPLALVTVLLVIANKRAARQLAERQGHGQGHGEDPGQASGNRPSGRPG